MKSANDNLKPFSVAISGPTRADLHRAIVTLQRTLEPGAAPKDWLVRYGVANADGWPTATLQRRPEAEARMRGLRQ